MLYIKRYGESVNVKKCARLGISCGKGVPKSKSHREKIGIGVSKFRLGKSWEDIYGKELANELKRNLSVKMTGKPAQGPFDALHCKNMSESRKNSKVYQDWMKSDEYRETRRKIAVKYHHGDELSYEMWLQMTDDRQIYYSHVWYYTNKQNLKILENYDKRGHCSNDTNAYHLDHIIPISYGFINNISPEIIGNINNLQFIHWRENIIKSNKVDLDV